MSLEILAVLVGQGDGHRSDKPVCNSAAASLAGEESVDCMGKCQNRGFALAVQGRSSAAHCEGRGCQKACHCVLSAMAEHSEQSTACQ